MSFYEGDLVKQIRTRLTYANVMSSIAVFLVLGGGAAIAALGKNTVGPRQLKPNSVKTSKIAKNAVKAAKIAENAVDGTKIADNAVTTSELADNAVTPPKIANEAVIADKIANDAVTTAKIANDAMTTAKIANDAVSTPKIANDAATGAKVNEATLGTVPSATNAAALGGIAASNYARRFFARVSYSDPSPTLLASSPGVVAIEEAALGFPRLVFPQSMDNCAVVVSASTAAGSQITRRSTGGSGTTVQFAIQTDAGAPARASFDVIAVC